MSCCNTMMTDLGIKAADQKSCFTHSNVAVENKKEFRLMKGKQQARNVCCLKVDGCWIKSSDTKKCDYLFKLCESNEYHLVEFKDHDAKEAMIQIAETLKQLKRSLGSQTQATFKAFIVSGALPQKANMEFRTLQKKFFKTHGIPIKRETNKMIIQV